MYKGFHWGLLHQIYYYTIGISQCKEVPLGASTFRFIVTQSGPANVQGVSLGASIFRFIVKQSGSANVQGVPLGASTSDLVLHNQGQLMFKAFVPLGVSTFRSIRPS